jgi:hypothetical protein
MCPQCEFAFGEWRNFGGRLSEEAFDVHRGISQGKGR